jgi:diguanylate cyclase (GGDEF)-like protein
MSTLDKALKLLLELNDPAARRTRAEQLDHALRTLIALTDGDAAVVLSPASRRGERLVLHAGSGSTAILPPPPKGSEVVRQLGEDGAPVMVGDLTEDVRLNGADGCPGVEAGPAMFAALRGRDPVPGYIAVYRRRGRVRFASADMRSIVMLASALGSSLEVLRLASGAEKVALTDDLTQVYNARFLKAALQRELRRAGRYGQELSVVLAGVDQYESWVAEQGDLRGSVLLKELAVLLAQQVRSFDLITRYGQEQFMAVLPQTGREGALGVAERMRACVAEHAFSNAASGAVTVSLAVATFPHDGAEAPAVLAAVERVLEQARLRGPNRVETPLHKAA